MSHILSSQMDRLLDENMLLTYLATQKYVDTEHNRKYSMLFITKLFDTLKYSLGGTPALLLLF